MPTLFARRYARKTEQVGRTERLVGTLVLLLTAGIVSLFVLHTATSREFLSEIQPAPRREPAASAAALNPFPAAGLPDWRAPQAADRFSADDLYLKINGEAAAYLQFGALTLTFGTYEHERDSDRIVDVYWYDMGTADNALRMYQTEEPPEATAVGIGSSAYQVGGAVYFCQGPNYVQVIPGSLDETDAQAALRIAERMAARIGGQ